jgi:chromosome segregation protein
MYLSKLEIHGFKSFANGTHIDFSPGVTAVVGPNGCGKSNIVDAVRWVIGEQRARILRSEKMENIIFNGTNTRRPLGMAEVMLTIVNDRGALPIEYSEVTIGRRLFRSGESEYLLNGVQCRLKDITDLFMDTGMGAGAYSVIELKMIEDILSEDAQDRRHMFEEAAGITKYKVRRGQTLRKLGNTRADLDRVRDIVGELEKHVRSLQRQAQKAARYKKLDERLRHLTLSLAVIEHRGLAGEDAALEKEICSTRDEVSSLTARLASEEAEYEVFRTKHIEREQAVVAAQTESGTHAEMIRSAEADLRLNRERLNAIERDEARAVENERLSVLRRATLEETLARISTEIESAKPEADNASRTLSDARGYRDASDLSLQNARKDLHSLARQEREAREILTEQSRTLDRLNSRIEVIEQDLTEIDEHFADLEQSIADVEARIEDLSVRLGGRQDELSEARSELESAREELTRREAKVCEIESGVRVVERKFDASVAEVALLESLLESYDEFPESVQFLASDELWTDAPLQTVSDILSADEAFRPALDAVLGAFSDCIVVDNKESAQRAISRLRIEKKGRATFFLLDRLSDAIHVAPPVDGSDGFTALTGVVSVTNEKYRRLADTLLRACFVVDDLTNLTPEGLPAGKYFNRRGEWLDTTGLMHAGGEIGTGTAASSRMYRRNQLADTIATRDSLNSELQILQKALAGARETADAVKQSPLMEKVEKAALGVTEAEKAHSRAVYEREILLRRKEESTQRRNSLISSRDNFRLEIESIESRLEGLRKRVAALADEHTENEESFSELETAGRTAFSLFNEANILAVQTKNRYDNLIRDRSRTLEDLKRLREEADRRSASITELARQRTESESNTSSLEREIRELLSKRSGFEEALSQSRDAMMEVKVAISEIEVRLRDLRRAREEAMTKESDQSVRRAQISTRLSDLVLAVEEDYQIDLRTIEYETEPDLSPQDARAEIQDLRSRIRNLGPVNALALESFEEEQQRLEFLHVQMSDLENAEATLRETIAEINQTASARFSETLDAVRKNFSSLFSELFGENASADLVLENPSDPLESAIQILAKPRGKKPSVLAQLSGGEKTLTAIALLFSIYLVKPSPFCILDEVDAPLDDANVKRLMHLIRTFSESTQFVLVTHNKRTMEAADRMYGITMQETGVSRLVGVTFESDLQLVA